VCFLSASRYFQLATATKTIDESAGYCWIYIPPPLLRTSFSLAIGKFGAPGD
jgi:hypothetical protein